MLPVRSTSTYVANDATILVDDKSPLQITVEKAVGILEKRGLLELFIRSTNNPAERELYFRDLDNITHTIDVKQCDEIVAAGNLRGLEIRAENHYTSGSDDPGCGYGFYRELTLVKMIVINK